MKLTHGFTTDFRITKAKLWVMVMTVFILVAASQLSVLLTFASQNGSETKEQTFKPVRELDLDVFTVKDPLETGGSTIPASFNSTGYRNQLFTSQDSLIFENDSTFTID